jgi:hypothetical protein
MIYMMGTTITGVMIVKAPYPHLHPLVSINDWAAGGPMKVVTMYGVVVIATMKARFLRLDVSATKTLSTYAMPSNPTQ